MPYFASLYNNRTKKWTLHEYKSIIECRKACYKNIKETNAYNIPITMSKTGKRVIGEVHTNIEIINGKTVNTGIVFSGYQGYSSPGLYPLKPNGTVGRMILTTQNYQRKLYLSDE